MSTPDKNTNEDDRKPAAKTASIWDTTESEELLQHPFLQVVFSLVMQNLGNCMSRSYRDVDSKKEKDHQKVMLGLPGKFGIEQMKTIAKARAGGQDGGIFFNKDLIENSTVLARKHMKAETSVNNMLQDMGVLLFIAMLQEALERELGHLKYHLEGVRDDNNGKIDEDFSVKTPVRLRHESGYMVQQRIREDNFEERLATCDVRILDFAKPQPDNSHFQPPLNVVFQHLMTNPPDEEVQFDFVDDFEDEDVEEEVPKAEEEQVERDSLLEHMNYPKYTVRCGRKRKRDKDDDKDYSVSPPDNNDSSKKGGSGNQPPPSSGRSGGAWLESIRGFLPNALQTAYALTKEVKQKPLLETGPNGEDNLKWRPAKGSLYKAMHHRKCVYKIDFCNENRQIKTSFTKSESIYVLLRMSNPTENVISIGTPVGNCFGRFLLDIRIDGLDQRRRDCRIYWKALQPNSSYTFFKKLAAPTISNCDRYSLAYVTPPIPGQYTARVWLSEEEVDSSKSVFSITR